MSDSDSDFDLEAEKAKWKLEDEKDQRTLDRLKKICDIGERLIAKKIKERPSASTAEPLAPALERKNASSDNPKGPDDTEQSGRKRRGLRLAWASRSPIRSRLTTAPEIDTARRLTHNLFLVST